jgi:hypothetical protein
VDEVTKRPRPWRPSLIVVVDGERRSLADAAALLGVTEPDMHRRIRSRCLPDGWSSAIREAAPP